MKNLLVLAIPLALLFAAPAAAQESPDMHLEFVKRLRGRGFADLALTHLETLKRLAEKSPQRWEPILPILPLETARTRVILAKVKSPEERQELLVKAEQELNSYLAKKAKTAEAPQLKLEIARVVMYQGQALLGEAFRQEDAIQKKEKAEAARKKFIAARAKFDDAIKAITGLLDTYKNPDPKQEEAFKKDLMADLLEGKFERAKTYLYEARAFLDPQDGKLRLEQAQLYKKAYEVLGEEVVNDKSGANDEVRWMAGAWIIEVGRLAGEGKDIEDTYKKLTNPKLNYPKEALPAQRWAKYFYIQGVRDGHFQPPENATTTQYIQALCADWLQKYPKHHDTTPGIGVQYELAHALFKQAASTNKKYSEPKTRKLYDTAQKYFEIVADSNSDLAQEANNWNIRIKLLQIGETTSVAELQDFEQCFLKARYEMFQLSELGKNGKLDEKELKKKQKAHLKTIIQAFRRALRLKSTLPPGSEYKIDEVYYFLAYVHLISGDPYRAALLGDYLTHKEPPGKHAPIAAGYAIKSYDAILRAFDAEINRKKMFDLAHFIINERGKLWKDEPIVEMAKYQIALVHLREKDYFKTIDNLEKLEPDFKAYTFAQCQLAFVALKISKEAKKNKNDKLASEYQQKAMQALRRIPQLPKAPDPATIQMFFAAQLQHGIIQYNKATDFLREGKEKVAAAKYKEMAEFTKKLLAAWEKHQQEITSEKSRQELNDSLQSLGKYARLGEANLAYKDGEYDKVLSKELTGAIVDRVIALGQGKEEIALSDYQVTGDLLGLAMRAHVQNGDLKKAEEILDLLQRLRDPFGFSDPTAVLTSLIRDLQIQVRDLRDKGDEKKLKETVANFSNFLDTLANRKDTKLSFNEIVFLANCYASLDQHTESAKQYEKLTPPPQFKPDPSWPEEKKLQEKEKHAKQVQLYWLLQVKCAEQWRLAEEFDKAETVLKKVLDAPQAAGKLLARKEQIHLLEDKGNFFKAIESWSSYLQNPGLRQQLAKGNVKAKELYFDCYYHYAWSWYMFSQNQGKKHEERYLKKAASYIWLLEKSHLDIHRKAEAKGEKLTEVTGWQLIGDRFEKLLKEAPALQREYEKMKSSASVSAK